MHFKPAIDSRYLQGCMQPRDLALFALQELWARWAQWHTCLPGTVKASRFRSWAWSGQAVRHGLECLLPRPFRYVYMFQRETPYLLLLSFFSILFASGRSVMHSESVVTQCRFSFISSPVDRFFLLEL